MPVTQTDIDNLNEAIASGTRQVTIGGQSVTYHSIDSLIKARDDLQSQLIEQESQTSGRRRPRRTRLYYAGRGYDK